MPKTYTVQMTEQQMQLIHRALECFNTQVERNPIYYSDVVQPSDKDELVDLIGMSDTSVYKIALIPDNDESPVLNSWAA